MEKCINNKNQFNTKSRKKEKLIENVAVSPDTSTRKFKCFHHARLGVPVSMRIKKLKYKKTCNRNNWTLKK